MATANGGKNYFRRDMALLLKVTQSGMLKVHFQDVGLLELLFGQVA